MKNRFYTNVVCLGDYIFERGIENGLPFEDKKVFKDKVGIFLTIVIRASF